MYSGGDTKLKGTSVKPSVTTSDAWKKLMREKPYLTHTPGASKIKATPIPAYEIVFSKNGKFTVRPSNRSYKHRLYISPIAAALDNPIVKKEFGSKLESIRDIWSGNSTAGTIGLSQLASDPKLTKFAAPHIPQIKKQRASIEKMLSTPVSDWTPKFTKKLHSELDKLNTWMQNLHGHLMRKKMLFGIKGILNQDAPGWNDGLVLSLKEYAKGKHGLTKLERVSKSNRFVDNGCATVDFPNTHVKEDRLALDEMHAHNVAFDRVWHSRTWNERGTDGTIVKKTYTGYGELLVERIKFAEIHQRKTEAWKKYEKSQNNQKKTIKNFDRTVQILHTLKMAEAGKIKDKHIIKRALWDLSRLMYAEFKDEHLREMSQKAQGAKKATLKDAPAYFSFIRGHRFSGKASRRLRVVNQRVRSLAFAQRYKLMPADRNARNFLIGKGITGDVLRKMYRPTIVDRMSDPTGFSRFSFFLRAPKRAYISKQYQQAVQPWVLRGVTITRGREQLSVINRLHASGRNRRYAFVGRMDGNYRVLDPKQSARMNRQVMERYNNQIGLLYLAGQSPKAPTQGDLDSAGKIAWFNKPASCAKLDGRKLLACMYTANLSKAREAAQMLRKAYVNKYVRQAEIHAKSANKVFTSKEKQLLADFITKSWSTKHGREFFVSISQASTRSQIGAWLYNATQMLKMDTAVRKGDRSGRTLSNVMTLGNADKILKDLPTASRRTIKELISIINCARHLNNKGIKTSTDAKRFETLLIRATKLTKQAMKDLKQLRKTASDNEGRNLVVNIAFTLVTMGFGSWASALTAIRIAKLCKNLADFARIAGAAGRIGAMTQRALLLASSVGKLIGSEVVLAAGIHTSIATSVSALQGEKITVWSVAKQFGISLAVMGLSGAMLKPIHNIIGIKQIAPSAKQQLGLFARLGRYMTGKSVPKGEIGMFKNWGVTLAKKYGCKDLIPKIMRGSRSAWASLAARVAPKAAQSVVAEIAVFGGNDALVRKAMGEKVHFSLEDSLLMVFASRLAGRMATRARTKYQRKYMKRDLERLITKVDKTLGELKGNSPQVARQRLALALLAKTRIAEYETFYRHNRATPYRGKNREYNRIAHKASERLTGESNPAHTILGIFDIRVETREDISNAETAGRIKDNFGRGLVEAMTKLSETDQAALKATAPQAASDPVARQRANHILGKVGYKITRDGAIAKKATVGGTVLGILGDFVPEASLAAVNSGINSRGTVRPRKKVTIEADPDGTAAISARGRNNKATTAKAGATDPARDNRTAGTKTPIEPGSLRAPNQLAHPPQVIAKAIADGTRSKRYIDHKATLVEPGSNRYHASKTTTLIVKDEAAAKALTKKVTGSETGTLPHGYKIITRAEHFARIAVDNVIVKARKGRSREYSNDNAEKIAFFADRLTAYLAGKTDKKPAAPASLKGRKVVKGLILLRDKTQSNGLTQREWIAKKFLGKTPAKDNSGDSKATANLRVDPPKPAAKKQRERSLEEKIAQLEADRKPKTFDEKLKANKGLIHPGSKFYDTNIPQLLKGQPQSNQDKVLVVKNEAARRTLIIRLTGTHSSSNLPAGWKIRTQAEQWAHAQVAAAVEKAVGIDARHTTPQLDYSKQATALRRFVKLVTDYQTQRYEGRVSSPRPTVDHLSSKDARTLRSIKDHPIMQQLEGVMSKKLPRKLPSQTPAASKRGNRTGVGAVPPPIPADAARNSKQPPPIPVAAKGRGDNRPAQLNRPPTIVRSDPSVPRPAHTPTPSGQKSPERVVDKMVAGVKNAVDAVNKNPGLKSLLFLGFSILGALAGAPMVFGMVMPASNRRVSVRMKGKSSGADLHEGSNLYVGDRASGSGPRGRLFIDSLTGKANVQCERGSITITRADGRRKTLKPGESRALSKNDRVHDGYREWIIGGVESPASSRSVAGAPNRSDNRIAGTQTKQWNPQIHEYPKQLVIADTVNNRSLILSEGRLKNADGSAEVFFARDNDGLWKVWCTKGYARVQVNGNWVDFAAGQNVSVTHGTNIAFGKNHSSPAGWSHAQVRFPLTPRGTRPAVNQDRLPTQPPPAAAPVGTPSSVWIPKNVSMGPHGTPPPGTPAASNAPTLNKYRISNWAMPWDVKGNAHFNNPLPRGIRKGPMCPVVKREVPSGRSWAGSSSIYSGETITFGAKNSAHKINVPNVKLAIARHDVNGVPTFTIKNEGGPMKVKTSDGKIVDVRGRSTVELTGVEQLIFGNKYEFDIRAAR